MCVYYVSMAVAMYYSFIKQQVCYYKYNLYIYMYTMSFMAMLYYDVYYSFVRPPVPWWLYYFKISIFRKKLTCLLFFVRRSTIEARSAGV